MGLSFCVYTLAAVSYTHLLKFKRDKQIVLVDFGTNLAKGDTASVTFKSVSYTHLDVYKRQSFNNLVYLCIKISTEFFIKNLHIARFCVADTGPVSYTHLIQSGTRFVECDIAYATDT